MSLRSVYTGPALFSHGFRLFFLSATLFALFVIPVWWAVWRGAVVISGPFVPTDWHSHEMIYGYASAVVAGFLFTAVPNWTGRLPTRGWPLMLVLAVWIAGRLACIGGTGLGPRGVMAVDQLFLLVVSLMISREIVAGRNWRNLKVLVPVILLWISNLVFHFEAMSTGTAQLGRRLGISVLIFLIMLIGGRILPSFTRNWLAAGGSLRRPVVFNRFDAGAIAVGVAALVSWSTAPDTLTSAVLAMLAALTHLLRLARWQGVATFRSPLLLMLHCAYLFIPLGFAAVALGALGIVTPAVGAHLFGIGAIGGMTTAVIMRATMGHTGRELVAGPMLTLAFGSLVSAAAARVVGGGISFAGLDGVSAAALFWTLAFATLAARIGPWLALPRASRKAPSKPGEGLQR